MTLPDDFVITRVGAGRVATVGGGQRQAVVERDPRPGLELRRHRQRRRERGQLGRSNAVTTSGAPGAPTNVPASGTFGGSAKIEKFFVDVSWGAAPDNGSPITGYRVR